MRHLAFIGLLFVTPAFSFDAIPLSSWDTAPMSFTFSTSQGPIVTIHADGTVELGENVTLDEASKAFWAQLQREGMKLACPKPQ